MMQKRIYVVYTGGTLGMQKTEQGFRPVANWFEQQLRALPEFNSPEMPEFTLHEYSPLLDSSDIHPQHWQTIAQDIINHYESYDGFVVLHGTDTMAYTAAGLHYLLEGLTKPVILTGAQIPLSEPNTDTILNVRNALYAAAYSGINQVGLLFHKHLLKAEYPTKFDAQSLNGFASFNAEPLLTWSDSLLQLPKSDIQPQSTTNQQPTPKLNKITPKKVGVITFYPGMDFKLLDTYLKQNWDTVILHSFGAGNIPQHPLLWQTLKETVAAGVQLINCTQCAKGEVQIKYASGYKMAELGVLSAGDKTLESTIAWAYSNQQIIKTVGRSSG